MYKISGESLPRNEIPSTVIRGKRGMGMGMGARAIEFGASAFSFCHTSHCSRYVMVIVTALPRLYNYYVVILSWVFSWILLLKHKVSLNLGLGSGFNTPTHARIPNCKQKTMQCTPPSNLHTVKASRPCVCSHSYVESAGKTQSSFSTTLFAFGSEIPKH